jgi:general secretion pathway protein K
MVGARNKSQRGIALLVVLLGVALLTLVVVDFSTTSAMGYLSAGNQADEVRAYYLARSAISVGAALLNQSAQMHAANGGVAYDGLTDVWATPFPPLPVEGGAAELSVVDETRKFNINQIVDPSTGQPSPIYLPVAERLFENLQVSPNLLPAIIDWLDPDSVESPNGAEADYYMKLIPPYMPRNGPMPTIGDLRMIKGIDDATFNQLRRCLTVMPETQVNINTAEPEVLGALTLSLQGNPGIIKQIMAVRMVQPFLKVSDVFAIPALAQDQDQLSRLLTTSSQYFTISGMGAFSGARKLVYATVQRQSTGALVMTNWKED